MRIKKLLLLLLLAVSASNLFADFTLEYNMEGNMRQVVQYKDAQHVKITTSGGEENMAQLIVGKKHYMIVDQDGTLQYTDMDEMINKMKGFSSMFGEIPKDQTAPTSHTPIKVIKKGKKKIVAGIDSEVWRVEAVNEGKKEQMDMIVTNDSHFVNAIHHYIAAMNQFSKMGGEENSDMSDMFDLGDGYVTVEFEGMKLVKFDESDLPTTLFDIPHEVGYKAASTHNSSTTQKPPLCPLVGSHGDAEQLTKMLFQEVNGWKLIEKATCLNMMKMKAENAIYQNADAYIHINLSINVDGENGIIAKYRTNNMNVSDLKKGKIQGNRYQSGLLDKVQQYAMDIKLPNAILTLTSTKNFKDDLPNFAKSAFDLSKFVPEKKSKPSVNDALESLGGLFGGQSGSSNNKPQNNADMKAAEEMLKGIFGK